MNQQIDPMFRPPLPKPPTPADAGPGWLDTAVGTLRFLRSFVGTGVALPLLMVPTLLPLTSQLLLLPAVLPDETVITDSNRRRDLAGNVWHRFVNLLIALSSVVALFGSAGVFAEAVAESGSPLYWLTLFNTVYLADLALLLAVGRVPLAYNARNLTVRWPITLLTAVAFTVVIGLLVPMLGFVNGMYRLTQESGQPGNVIVLSDGATDEVFSDLGYNDTANIERQRALLDETDKPLATPVGVMTRSFPGGPKRLASAETYVIVNQPSAGLDPAVPIGSPASLEGKRRFVQVRGVVDPEVCGAVHGIPLRDGDWFSAAGVQTPAGAKPGERDRLEAVLGEGLAREFGKVLGQPEFGVGSTFNLSDRPWVVVGVTKSDGTAFGSELWAKQSIVGPMFRKDRYTSIVLRADSDDLAGATALAYELRTRTTPKVGAITEAEYFNKLSATNKQLLNGILFVAAVMAMGGIFGVMNTMFAAIAQRIKDVGVLRILGFKRWQVLISFLLESLLIALAGGLLGMAFGSLFNGLSATSSISSGQGGGKTVIVRIVIDAQVLLAGLLFTLAMGRIGGLIPALSAMRLKILDTLRA